MKARSRLHTRFALLLAPAMIGANLVGALAAYVFLSFLSPDRPAPDDPTGTLVNTIVFLGYSGLAVVLGTVGSAVVILPVRRWARGDTVADEAMRYVVLRTPARLVRVYGALWALAAVLFAALNLNDSVGEAVVIGVSVIEAGLTTCALSYLLAERLVRPIVAAAMAGATQPPPVVLRVRRRILLAWVLGTGVPVGGVLYGVLDLDGGGTLGRGGVIFLCTVALVVGLMAVLFTARSISDPVGSVSEALRRVAAGDLDVQVPVYDGSEIGQLQSGVNVMVVGLRERERLRDLYGRQVGPDVARLALQDGVRLGGERREVAVLFVDVIGSTRLAVTEAPEHVVAQLNAFFSVVVDAAAAHGGWVNKFEGDAALCVFGAPVDLEQAGDCALAAARALAAGLAPLPLEAAIGVAAGPVVAGHVGAERRFEYTVIGDPVNTAARLSELARDTPGRVLADAALVAAAGAEQEQWAVVGEPVVLRGRQEPTGLARPCAP
ncbi:MAG: adenylate/guanylate cyclase domain-containing protein [Frankiales bacterium]|nr:adenylate/guanylate cyclase domain-containing protein [Frankiales bacterium]